MQQFYRTENHIELLHCDMRLEPFVQTSVLKVKGSLDSL